MPKAVSRLLPTRQRTVAHAVSLSGVGLHSGVEVNIRICPAAENHGVVFKRIDTKKNVLIPALHTYVTDTRLCTCLEHEQYKIATVEHLLSAVAGLQLDNLLIEIDGPEVPIMDGSSAPFVFMLRSAGIVEQDAYKSVVKVLDPIEVSDGKKYCKLLPYDGFKLSMEIDFAHPAFIASNQRKTIDMCIDSYDKTVSRARTFGFVEEVEYLQKNNLAKGASLHNAVGFDSQSIVNPPLRYHDEPVTHKILDAIGDLALLGNALSAEFIGYCSGHKMNKMLVDKLVANPGSWVLA